MNPSPDLSRFNRILKKDDPVAAVAFIESTTLNRNEALALATESSAEKIVLSLLAEGADPNASIPSALVRAIESGCHHLLDPLFAAGANLGPEAWWEDGDHPLASAALMADPIAMRWLCDKGAVKISDPRWLWDALSHLAVSRKKDAIETLLILGPHILERIQGEDLPVDIGVLTKAALKLRRVKKRHPTSKLRSSLQL